jgi:hypothetical protein
MTEAGGDLGNDEVAYERECWAAVEECKNLNPPYYPTAWIGMMQRWGAAEAARRLLVSGEIQDGFQRLIDADRADLTVEWSALYPRWNQIFHDGHRAAARWRLRQAGVELNDDPG